MILDFDLYEMAKQEFRLQLFSYKNVSNIASKIFAIQPSLFDHLKHKIVNKTTCRMPAANSRQL